MFRNRAINCHTTSFEKWLSHIDAFVSYKTWKLTGETKYATDFVDFDWHQYYKKGYLVTNAVNEVLQNAGYLPSESINDF